jgi:DNA-nicking Smr family endonuclease
MAEARRAITLQRLVGNVGDVDVENRRSTQRCALNAHDQFTGYSCSGGEVLSRIRMRNERHGNCRQAEKSSFDGRGDCARIEHVIAEIRAIVDSRDNHVVLLVKQTGDRKVHAVCWRAVDEIPVLPIVEDSQWHIQRQRIARPAAIPIRSDDRRRCQGGQCVDEGSQSFGAIAVVITDQNLHELVRARVLRAARAAKLYWNYSSIDRDNLIEMAGVTNPSKNDKPTVEPDDLFRQEVRDVRPLPRGRERPTAPKPSPQARFRRADEHSVLDESLNGPIDPELVESADELSFRRDNVSPGVLRKLRNGSYAVDDELDLHGLNSAQAKAALRDFLNSAHVYRRHCIRIIHGKGHRSGPRGPVLKNVVNAWLRRHASVAAFASARPLDGGVGAVYVLLRSK